VPAQHDVGAQRPLAAALALVGSISTAKSPASQSGLLRATRPRPFFSASTSSLS
jgi:hypothetical protein